MWRNVERGRPQITIWRMRIACWIPKATDTHLQYVIRFAFPLQQWLHDRASMLRHTYIACLVLIGSSFTNQSLEMGRLEQVQAYVKERNLRGPLARADRLQILTHSLPAI